jgi:hypothetical protein
MWERGERKRVFVGRRGKNVQRERERKEQGEILNESGRKIGWVKEIWKRRDRMEKERGRG